MFPQAPLFVTTAAGLVVGLLLLIPVPIVLRSAIVVDAYEKRALTVLGEYRKQLEPGINVVPPFVSNTYSYDMRTQTLDELDEETDVELDEIEPEPQAATDD